MSQLDIWRLQAVDRIKTLAKALNGELSPSDALIDSLVRNLGRLPARPADKPPYVGIFGVSDVSVGREKAVERLRSLSGTLQGNLCPNDGLVDDLVRSLSHLPPRPADKQPYASLFPVSKLVELSAAQLSSFVPDAESSQLARLAPCLLQTMVEFEIDRPLRQAHFLAQVAHESDRFRTLEEYASGEDYEGRDDLGNIYGGDGVRYKGRGLIQITGRANYADCGHALGVDLINNPKRLADPALACQSAGWFWDKHRLNLLADRDDAEAITRIINGGLNGYDERLNLLKAAKRVLGIR